MFRWAFASALLLIICLGVGFQPRTDAQDKVKGQLTFEIYKDTKGEFRWRLKAANSAVIASSAQGYKAKADCEHGVDLIKEGAAKAKVKDTTSK